MLVSLPREIFLNLGGVSLVKCVAETRKEIKHLGLDLARKYDITYIAHKVDKFKLLLINEFSVATKI